MIIKRTIKYSIQNQLILKRIILGKKEKNLYIHLKNSIILLQDLQGK